MDLSEIISELGLSDILIKVTLKVPKRIGDEYKAGRLAGSQPGYWGGCHYDYQKDFQCPEAPKRPMSFDSRRIHQLKQTRVLVVYNCFTWGGREHSDWVPIENCDFEIVRK